MNQQFKMPAEVIDWSKQDDLLVEARQKQIDKETRKADLFGVILFISTICYYWINK